MESQDRLKRHRAIRALVQGSDVPSQQELARLLARRGIEVTQATLSRDLRELRMLRAPAEGGGYRYREAAAETNGNGAEERRLRSVAALEVTGIDANETCVVVRTLTGRAQGVAVFLDGLDVGDLLATIAGDDTILVIPRSVKRTGRLRAALSDALGL